jgi:hypothetical protein
MSKSYSTYAVAEIQKDSHSGYCNRDGILTVIEDCERNVYVLNCIDLSVEESPDADMDVYYIVDTQYDKSSIKNEIVDTHNVD